MWVLLKLGVIIHPSRSCPSPSENEQASKRIEMEPDAHNSGGEEKGGSVCAQEPAVLAESLLPLPPTLEPPSPPPHPTPGPPIL